MNNVILNWKEHLHHRPDVHVGSNEIIETKIFLFKENKIVQVKERVNKALLQCIREIVYNALDHKWRSNRETELSIEFDGEMFTIKNTGDPISLEKGIFTQRDSETNIISTYELYYPEAYFGIYWTGSNYDDSKEIKTSGKNGMGAKIVNALSKLFYVECSDGKKIYKQSYHNNLESKTEPNLTDVEEEIDPYVKIKFFPDYKGFFKWKNTELLNGYLKKLCYDCSIVSKSSVYFNKELIPINGYKDYLELYGILVQNEIVVKREELEVIFLEVPKGSILNVSFANGNFVTSGAHIRTVRQITLKSICDYLNKEFDIPDENKITVKTITSTFFFFIILFKRGIQYTSQTKEEVASNVEYDFQVDKNIENIIKKWKIYSNVEDMIVAKIKKTFNPYKLVKLEDANLAGSQKSLECTLFITEGLSAKSFAVEGITTLGGRDKYGVFPVKGKFLNVTKASNIKVITNKEVISLQTILGIEKGIDYSVIENRKKLRYGRVDLLTDNDSDGKHIKGLLLNFFHYINRSLYDMGFVQCTNTPIIRIYTSNSNFLNCYSMKDIPEIKGRIKYYKGLGSHSSGTEIEDCFKNQKITNFRLDESCSQMFTIMFATGYESVRRDIIIEAIKNGTDTDVEEVRACTSYLSNEMVDFQREILKRNIPDFLDGLKETQRKILFTLLDKPRKEINVSKLAGIVSDKTNYHHGNEPLETVIINMSQNFCGANNIPILEPIGQFGTRNENGKDCSAGRYISVKLNNFFKKLYYIESLLEYNEEEGEKVEPIRFYPPIPYYLINGCDNISPGFRSFIPPYKLSDIINEILNIINGNKTNILTPYYKGYKGEVVVSDDKFQMDGLCIPEVKGITRILEIPITTGFSDYKQMLKEYESEKKISNLKDYSTGNSIDMKFKNISLELEDLKLKKVFHLNNLFVIKDGVPRRYNNITELLIDFVEEYKKILEKRKKLELKELDKDITILSQKIRFIKDFRYDIIDLKDETFNTISKLKDLNYENLGEIYEELGNNYDYLLSLKAKSLSKDRIESLEDKLKKKIINRNDVEAKESIDVYKETLNNLLN